MHPREHAGEVSREPLAGSDSTWADVIDAPPGRTARWLRRGGVVLLCAIVLAAAFNLLGTRTSDMEAEADGWSLALEYPSITRAGEPVPLHVSVTASGGFGKVVQLRLCDELFDDLDFQNWYPNPSAETSAPAAVVYEFDAPPSGDTLEVSLDARSAPGQFGEVDDCEVAVLVDDAPVVSTSFTVWRLP